MFEEQLLGIFFCACPAVTSTSLPVVPFYNGILRLAFGSVHVPRLADELAKRKAEKLRYEFLCGRVCRLGPVSLYPNLWPRAGPVRWPCFSPFTCSALRWPRMDKRRICDGSDELRALKERLHMAKVNKDSMSCTDHVLRMCLAYRALQNMKLLPGACPTTARDRGSMMLDDVR